jgi:hypothetical protein
MKWDSVYINAIPTFHQEHTYPLIHTPDAFDL